MLTSMVLQIITTASVNDTVLSSNMSKNDSHCDLGLSLFCNTN